MQPNSSLSGGIRQPDAFDGESRPAREGAARETGRNPAGRVEHPVLADRGRLSVAGGADRECHPQPHRSHAISISGGFAVLRQSMRFAVAMACREARGSPAKFVIAIIVMGVAVAAAAGLRSVTAGFARDEINHARAWLAADMSAVYLGHAPSDEQWSAVRRLGGGVQSTQVAEIATLLSSDQAADPVSATVKIVDPAAYPYYGRLELTSGADARAILNAGELIASSDLVESLHVKPGGTIRIAATDFRIGGVIAAEPDRFAIPSAPVGRVIVSSSAAKSTGLTDFGAQGFFRVLLRTPPEEDRRTLCTRLDAIFPDAHVI